MGRKRIYEEGYIEAKKATCDRKLVHAGKTKEISWNSADGNTDISQCIKLLGREILINAYHDTTIAKKKAKIIMLYPHMALAMYKGGINDEHEFRVGLGIADLIEKGLLTFKHGIPEVIS